MLRAGKSPRHVAWNEVLGILTEVAFTCGFIAVGLLICYLFYLGR
jgi:hypothetical protein